MTVRKRILQLAAITFMWMVCSTGGAWALGSAVDSAETGSIRVGAEFASGDYGTATTTDSWYFPVIATWFPTDRIDVGVEIPYLYQSNANVTSGLFQNRYGSAARQLAGGGGPGGKSRQPGDAASSSADSGLGDIILRFGVIALFEGEFLPQMRPSIFVKFPTADSDGLGTGEFDAGGGIELSKWLTDWHLLGEGLFTYQGRADGFALKNYVSFTAGVGYLWTDSLETMVLTKGATAPSEYSTDLLEVRGRIVWAITDAVALDVYGSRGLADSSPDYGGGMALVYSF